MDNVMKRNDNLEIARYIESRFNELIGVLGNIKQIAEDENSTNEEQERCSYILFDLMEITKRIPDKTCLSLNNNGSSSDINDLNGLARRESLQ